MVLHGDSLIVLKDLPDNSIECCVTDPPYGLSFMGKKWDYDVPSKELWAEVLRVLKPGGHLLSFGGTRTYHRMVVQIEDAGFDIRDQIMWIYGSGFPKSLDVSKAIDKAAGVAVEKGAAFNVVGGTDASNGGSKFRSDHPDYMPFQPATATAKQWQGWGTALKPANEPIVLARKPLEKGLTVAENVQKWGTGALNIDGTRIAGAFESGWSKSGSKAGANTCMSGPNYERAPKPDSTQGRWPANVLFDEEAAAMLDEQSGITKSTGGTKAIKQNLGVAEMNASKKGANPVFNFGDVGGASRFFYVAKASKRERNAGLEMAAPTKSQGARPNSADASGKFPDHDHRERGGNNHPTVKPVKLMEYLITLVCPPGGIVLDPFMGSGTTGVAAKQLGAEFIGIEREAEYVAIAEKRIG